MGGSYWNDDHYRDREEVRKKANAPVFAHTHAISTGTVAAKTHDKLNPFDVKIRESRDSAAHPESLAIGVMFDVTGSMESVPRVLQAQLPKLMGLLISKGYVQHPQILFGAVGDATTDRGSLQVGQFESGIEMDDDIKRMWVEKGGGGQQPPRESYQNALYFFARHTAIDCLEKRNKKGYLFIIGDEHAYASVSATEIKSLCNVTLESDIPTAQIVKEAQEKYNVFYIIPTHTSHGSNPAIRESWSKLLGAENVLLLEDEATICELIALTVGLCEGTANLEAARKDLQTGGASATAVNAVAASLGNLAKNKGAAGTAKTARL